MAVNSGNLPGEPPAALVTALRKVLRPLVKLLLSNGITYPMLSNLLKSIYVETADQDFPVEGKRQTDSRISLLTGVHRKDVRRLRHEVTEEDDALATVSLGAQLVAEWVGNEDYQAEDGEPAPLARLRKSTECPSFETLVETVTRKNLRSRAMLDELVRLGVVTIDEDDHVVLNSAAFIPESGFDEKLYFFGKNVRDHIAACVDNLTLDNSPHFERSVFYDQLSEESIAKLDTLCRELGNDAIKQVNREAMKLQKRDIKQGAFRRRMIMGVFLYNTEYSSDDAAADEE